MTQTHQNKLYIALCFNALLLGLIAFSLLSHGGATPAMAQVAPTVSATAGALTIVPAQLSTQTFGCYLLDAEKQTLCVYQYKPGEHELRLEASRDVQYDRTLKQYNTVPAPTDIQKLVDRAGQPLRAIPPSAPKE